jgi:hypothetical protein
MEWSRIKRNEEIPRLSNTVKTPEALKRYARQRSEREGGVGTLPMKMPSGSSRHSLRKDSSGRTAPLISTLPSKKA